MHFRLHLWIGIVMAELVVIEGQDIGRTFEIGPGISTLGRSKKNTITLLDRRIGERQAEIEIQLY